MTADDAATCAAAATALLASPYLAGLTVSAPDRDNRTWWQPRRTSTMRVGVTAVAAGTLAALGGVATGWTAIWPAYLMLSLLGVVLAIVDVEHHRLPDRLILIAAGAGALLSLVAALGDGSWNRVGRAGLAAAVVFALFYVMALVSPRGVGLGDVKLAAMLAGYLAWFSWSHVVTGLASGFLASGVAGIALLATGHANRGTRIPLGPFLIGAALLAAAIQS
jgi:leader peptidase (prepilin peptidase)/N-methyltransferase